MSLFREVNVIALTGWYTYKLKVGFWRYNMEDIYHKYYLTDDQIKNIVKTGIIIFDTSALLDMYCYSEETQKWIINDVFAKINNRLWIPAQVYFEYLKNKDEVFSKPKNMYESLLITMKASCIIKKCR